MVVFDFKMRFIVKGKPDIIINIIILLDFLKYHSIWFRKQEKYFCSIFVESLTILLTFRKHVAEYHNKGNNKITELRTILQRESQNS